MKNLKLFSFVLVAVLSAVLFAGCVFGTVTIDNWQFKPEQASGSSLDLTLINSSAMTFDFTITNKGNDRELLAESFKVIIKNGEQEVEADAVTFENLKTKIEFKANTSANIKLNAVATKSNLSENSKILIKYSGSLICEYKVK